MLGGVNFVLHAAGWLEGGLAIGYEKFVLDDDQLGMMATFVKGLDLSRERPGARRDPREPAGQPLPRHGAHARQLRDRLLPLARRPTTRRFEQWLEDGALDAAQRANTIWKQRLAEYEPPPIDDAIDAELREYVARRKAELPDTFA